MPNLGEELIMQKSDARKVDRAVRNAKQMRRSAAVELPSA
jgi:hypothetical protein